MQRNTEKHNETQWWHKAKNAKIMQKISSNKAKELLLFGCQGHPPSALWHGAGLAVHDVIVCVVEPIGWVKWRLETWTLWTFTEFQLEAAQNAYREASGSQAGTAQTPTRYLKFKAFRIFRTQIVNRTAHISCHFMWPMLSRYFCLPREVWDPGWNCISNLKHMSLNFSFLDVTFNHWAYRPHRYDVILVAKYNHHHHHDILRYHVMYPYVLLSSFWTSWDALGDLTLSSSGNLRSCAVDDLLPYDPMPNIHPMDSKTPVAGFELPGIAGMSMELMESMESMIR